jgi:hypothetical protein
MMTTPVVGPGEVPTANQTNNLDWQTQSRDRFSQQMLSGVLANPSDSSPVICGKRYKRYKRYNIEYRT